MQGWFSPAPSALRPKSSASSERARDVLENTAQEDLPKFMAAQLVKLTAICETIEERTAIMEQDVTELRARFDASQQQVLSALETPLRRSTPRQHRQPQQPQQQKEEAEPPSLPPTPKPIYEQQPSQGSAGMERLSRASVETSNTHQANSFTQKKRHSTASMTSLALEMRPDAQAMAGMSDFRRMHAELQRGGHSDGHGTQLQGILEHLRALQVRHELRARTHSKWSVQALPTLHPDSRFLKLWDLVFATLLVFVCVKEPLSIGFADMFEGSRQGWRAFDDVADVFFILDMVLSAMTGYSPGRSQIVTTQPDVLFHYLRTWFTIDLLSTFPFHKLAGSGDNYDNAALRLAKFIRLLKLFKLLRLIRSSQALSRYLSHSHLAYMAHPALVRIMNLCGFLILTWHVIGCIWWFVRSSNAAVDANGDPLRPNFVPLAEGDVLLSAGSNVTSSIIYYVEAYYWAVSVTTGVGVVPTPNSHLEALFNGLISFCGMLLQAYTLGSAASALSTLDASKAERHRKIDMVKQYMYSKRVPLYLREKITDYFEHLYTQVQSIDEDKILKHLPFTLQVQLSVVLNQQLLLRMPLFKFVEPTCAAMLVLALKPALFLPYEVVLVESATNRILYFVRSGKVEVIVSEVGEKKLMSKKQPPRKAKAASSSSSSASPMAARRAGGGGGGESADGGGGGEDRSSNASKLQKILRTARTTARKDKANPAAVKRDKTRRFSDALLQVMRKASIYADGSAGKSHPDEGGDGSFNSSEAKAEAMSSLCTRYGLTHRLPEGFTSVAVLGESESFGEQSFISGAAAYSSVITLTYTELLCLDRADFDLVLEEYPSLATHVEGYKREMFMAYHSKTVQRHHQQSRSSLDNDEMRRGSCQHLQKIFRRTSNAVTFTKALRGSLGSRLERGPNQVHQTGSSGDPAAVRSSCAPDAEFLA